MVCYVITKTIISLKISNWESWLNVPFVNVDMAAVEQEVLVPAGEEDDRSSSLSPPHRRQHTEPPANSKQPPAAQSRRHWESRRARARRGVQDEERYHRRRRSQTSVDWIGWDTMTKALIRVHSLIIKCHKLGSPQHKKITHIYWKMEGGS